MKIKFVFIILFIALSHLNIAQEANVNALFNSQEPLEVKMGYAFKSLKRNASDTFYLPTYLHFKNENEVWDSVKIDFQARGHSRKQTCYYAPLRIKIKKKDSKGTIFEGNTSLKLVLPCQGSKNSNDLVIKEYLCYKLYEPITPYAFKTRLVNLALTDQTGKQPKEHNLKAFFLENDNLVAKRFDAKLLKGIKMNPSALQDTAAIRQEFFEYLIANTDWSNMTQHNIRIIQLPSKANIPVPYDFDMSGLVNAPYARVNDMLAITSVRQRLYRGFCRNPEMLEYIRAEYISREPQILAALQSIEHEINPKELPVIKKYLDEFFIVLKNDKRFRENILENCRSL